jgi:hypothetical protein
MGTMLLLEPAELVFEGVKFHQVCLCSNTDTDISSTHVLDYDGLVLLGRHPANLSTVVTTPAACRCSPAVCV